MTRNHDRFALAVLIAGACTIGFSPILVRLAHSGPAAAGFWRVGFALPLMAAIAAIQHRRGERLHAPSPILLLAGVLFAVDLGCWHYGLRFTSVANSTVLSNLTPILVALVAWLGFRERPTPLFALALAAAVGGSVLIGLAKGGGGRGLDPPLGDALSVLTAVFYGGYFLCVRQARATATTATVMLWSGAVSAPLLLVAALALGERLTPTGAGGWAAAAGLGLVQVSGQGAIAWALGRLPTALTAVVVLVQPVVAAVLGWIWLGEAVTPLQAVGGAVVLGAVALAQASGRRRPSADAEPIPAEGPAPAE